MSINEYELLNALENNTNSSIINLNSSKIKTIKNNILQKLQLDRDVLKKFHKKLKDYRYVDGMHDIEYGYYIRWISLKNPEKELKLTNGGWVNDMLIEKTGIQILLRNNQNRFFKIKLDECVVFQKLSDEEKVILSVLDLLKSENKL